MDHLKSFESFEVNEGIKSALFRGAIDIARLWSTIKKVFKGEFKDAWKVISDENYGKLKKIISFFIDNEDIFKNEENYDRLWDEAQKEYDGKISALFNDMYGGDLEADCDSVLKSMKEDYEKNKAKYDVKKRLKAQEVIKMIEDVKKAFGKDFDR